MADEYIDILNSDGNKTNQVQLKSEAHRLGLWHASVHIWLYTNADEVLLQKRSINKDTYPDLWDISTAGHIGAGESPIQAATRELFEELGYGVSTEALDFSRMHKASKTPTQEIIDNEFNHIYTCRLSQDISTLELQKEEVAAVKLISIEEFEKDLADHKKSLNYVPHGDKYYHNILSVLRTKK